MDIKLKSFNSSKLVKGIAFFVCVAFFLSSLTAFGFLINSARISEYGSGTEDLLLCDNYHESTAFQYEFGNKLNGILNILNQYKSEEFIKNGGTVTEQRLDDAVRSLFYDGTYYSQGYAYNYRGGETTITIADGYPAEKYGGNYDDAAVKQSFKRDYADKVEALKQALIMDDLRSFDEWLKDSDNIDGFTYYATDGESVITNIDQSATSVTPEQFMQNPAYLIYQDDQLIKSPASEDAADRSMKSYDKNLEARLDHQYNTKLEVFFGFDENYLKEQEAGFQEARNEIMRWLPPAILCMAASLILLIYLFIVTGKKDEEGNLVICKVDRFFTEFKLLAIVLLFVFGGYVFLNFMTETVNYGISYDGNLYMASGSMILSFGLAVIIGLLSAGFGLYFILSIVRDIKAGRLIKNFLIVKLVSLLWQGLKTVYYGGSLMRKVVLITLGICLVSATVVFAPLAAIAIIALAPKWVKKFEEVMKGIDEVKNGNLTYQIPVSGDGELDRLARGINQISEASNIAIQNELKNQRMKTDLISNVSHDLKTPLTSIITYVDLLKTEGLDHTEAPKYLEILDQKSMRLKKLTEDLFDAAKASSGAIPVKFEKVDLLSLINQGMGEMSDRIESSNLEFKVNSEKERYYVWADGQLLWRVMENLLGNIFKYAQEGSRVYLNLTEREEIGGRLMTVLEIKNISKDELNINADELMERFKRGDESRTTEGSGLGLAIAKDLVRLQNGRFEITIDGDLFKATVILEAYLPA